MAQPKTFTNGTQTITTSNPSEQVTLRCKAWREVTEDVQNGPENDTEVLEDPDTPEEDPEPAEDDSEDSEDYKVDFY